jgi:hypothetical protein
LSRAMIRFPSLAGLALALVLPAAAQAERVRD